MQVPRLPSDQLLKLKAMIEQGPPPEPGPEKPGRLMQMMTAFEQRYKQGNNGRDPTPMEYMGYLVHILDHKAWEEAMINYQQMKAVCEAHEKPLIERPGFIPPKDLKLVGPEGK
jgi:hypothetical protein